MEYGRPIKFINIDEDNNTLVMTQEAMTLLSGMKDRKINVVTLLGPCSSGKSFLAS